MDFFVSYTRVDLQWARWIAWQLEAAEYQIFIQDWDIRPGNNFIIEMQRAAEESHRTLAVVSPEYVKSCFTLPEWAAAVAKDPTGADGVMLPVRISEVDLRGLLKAIVYIDLVGLSEADARKALLEGVRQSRAKPADAPPFPKVEATFPRDGALPAPVPQYPAEEPAVPDPLRDWDLVDVEVTTEGNIALLLRPASSRMVTAAQTEVPVQAHAVLDRLVAQWQQQRAALDAPMRENVLQSLLPVHVRQRIAAAERVFFMTDVEAARYPWELLCAKIAEKGKSDGANHVQSSTVLRSFSTVRDAHRLVRDVSVSGALIIASPRVSATAMEVQIVAEQLGGGALIDVVISDEPRDVISALFKRPYAILHIIGRARLDATDSAIPGIFIGNELYLTAGEFEAMERLPELVFLHIEMAAKQDAAERPLEQARFAAAFAEKLMRAGVRCVIAAGWEVSDREALSFVREFYCQMTSGLSLQVATERAREATRRESRSSNAWASFFCFGYPEYRLPGTHGRAD